MPAAGDECAAAVHGLDQAALAQQRGGPADGVVADAELSGQLALGGQLRPGRQLIAGNPGGYPVSDPDVDQLRANPAGLLTIRH